MGLKDSFKKILPEGGPSGEAKAGKTPPVPFPDISKKTPSTAPGGFRKGSVPAKKPGFWGILKGEKPYSVDLSPGEIGRFAREQLEISKKLEKHQSERSGWKRVLRHPL